MIVREKVTEYLMNDVQGQADDRQIYINEVGISDLKIPLTIKGCEKVPDRSQNVQATLTLSVDLSKEKKGIHMSRLIETILEHSEKVEISSLPDLLYDIRKRQDAERANVKIEFNYFFSRTAPVTQKSFPQAYKCYLEGTLDSHRTILSQGVEVPVQTLCPCSKEISDYGAHNQRSTIWITLRHIVNKNTEIGINVEDMVNIAENSASSPLYPILKREDERYITMSAYDKPCFVEDVVRNVSSRLEKDNRFDSYEVRTVNYESIHNHNAYAVLNKSIKQI